MKLQREVRETILRNIENNPESTVDSIVELLHEYADAPDVQRLINQEYRATARRLLATSRDESRIRNIFSADDGDGTFVNLPIADDLDQVMKVYRQLLKKRDGINASLAKVRRRGEVLAGQTTMFDAESTAAGHKAPPQTAHQMYT